MKSKYIPGIRVNGLVEDAILGQDVVEDGEGDGGGEGISLGNS